MTTVNLSDIANHPDPGILFHEYEQKIHMLKTLNKEKISLRQNLIIVCEKNENISKRLLKVKKDYETLKSDLNRSLFQLNVAADKTKILSSKNLDEYFKKRKNLELHQQKSSVRSELEELIKLNGNLFEQCRRTTALMDLTKTQYSETMIKLQRNFNQKKESTWVLDRATIHSSKFFTFSN